MISLPEIVQLPCSYSFTYADPLFCYANEMNILRAFLWGCFFRTIDSHEFLRNNIITFSSPGFGDENDIIMIQIYSPMRKSSQHYFYFGGARSKGFPTLRNVSKLQFFDKIGHAKSVGFRFYSAI